MLVYVKRACCMRTFAHAVPHLCRTCPAAKMLCVQLYHGSLSLSATCSTGTRAQPLTHSSATLSTPTVSVTRLFANADLHGKCRCCQNAFNACIATVDATTARVCHKLMTAPPSTPSSPMVLQSAQHDLIPACILALLMHIPPTGSNQHHLCAHTHLELCTIHDSVHPQAPTTGGTRPTAAPPTRRCSVRSSTTSTSGWRCWGSCPLQTSSSRRSRLRRARW